MAIDLGRSGSEYECSWRDLRQWEGAFAGGDPLLSAGSHVHDTGCGSCLL